MLSVNKTQVYSALAQTHGQINSHVIEMEVAGVFIFVSGTWRYPAVVVKRTGTTAAQEIVRIITILGYFRTHLC